MSSSATEPVTGGPQDPENTGPSLTPYFLILFGASAGLASIITLLAEIRRALQFSDIGIGMAIASGFGAAFVASLVMAPHADRGRAPENETSGNS